MLSRITNHIRYPKFVTLGLSYALAYVLYQQGYVHAVMEPLKGHPYFSAFITGLFFSFGFTSAFAAALFLEASHVSNPVFIALAGGLGASIADVTLFEILKVSFADEWERIRASKPYQWLRGHVHRMTPKEKLRDILKLSVAVLIIASPLPDEIGITMLSGVLPDIDERRLGMLCFMLNTVGILAILAAGHAIR